MCFIRDGFLAPYTHATRLIEAGWAPEQLVLAGRWECAVTIRKHYNHADPQPEKAVEALDGTGRKAPVDELIEATQDMSDSELQGLLDAMRQIPDEKEKR